LGLYEFEFEFNLIGNAKYFQPSHHRSAICFELHFGFLKCTSRLEKAEVHLD